MGQEGDSRERAYGLAVSDSIHRAPRILRVCTLDRNEGWEMSEKPKVPKTLWRCRECGGKSDDYGYVHHVLFCTRSSYQPVPKASIKLFDAYDLRVKRKVVKRG